MCSKNMKLTLDLMDEPKPKIYKTKSNQMKHPAPFSQSWSGPPRTSKKASTNRSSAQKSAGTRRDTRPQLRFRGPDPTVPHLKYGLFPKCARRQSCTLSSSERPNSDAPEATKPRVRTVTEDDSSAPLFVVRALDSRLTRRLSLAASTHLDIKPRNMK